MTRFTKKPYGTWQFGKIGVLVNFIIPKLKFFKIAQLFIVSFSLVRGFLMEQEKIFSTYSDPRNYIMPATLVLSLNSHKKGLLK